MNRKVVNRNVFWAAVLQLSTIISGLIVPRLLLKYFGANVYGLTMSVSQFVNYISLLEGGVSGVVLAALYTPLVNNDNEALSRIINTVRRFFLKLGLVCIVYTCAVAFIYPLIKKTGYSREYIFALVVVCSFRLFIQYFLSLTFRLLLRADQKGYFVSISQIVIVWLSLGMTVVAVHVFKDIIWVKLISGLVYLVQPLLFGWYVRRHYRLDRAAGTDDGVLNQRWDGFGQNLAYFIHSNTDVLILTLFSTFPNIAIYSVYLLVADALKSLISVVSTAIVPSIGNVLAKGDKAEIDSSFDLYEFTVEFITFVLYCCAFALIIPFIRIYTADLTDAEYIQPLFGRMILLAEMLYCIREPYVNVAYAKGHFRQTKLYAYSEAALNLLISVLLVRKYHLVGVATGTVVSMLLRLIFQVHYLEKTILMRPAKLFYKRIAILGIGAVVSFGMSRFISGFTITNYFQWIMWGGITFVVVLCTEAAVSFLCYRNTFMRVLHFRRSR